MIQRLMALFAALILAGCAGPAKLPIDNLASSDNTPVEDLRPATESTRDIFSLLITSDRYGYVRLAQDVTDPSGARLFAHRLKEKHGNAAVPATKLHHFVVYMNNRAELKRGALGAAFGGAIGAAIAGSTVKREGDAIHMVADPARFGTESGDDEYKRAMYSEPQIPEGTSVYVIYIDSESQQKRRFTRTVWPVKAAKPGERLPLHQAMEAAIKFNLSP